MVFDWIHAVIIIILCYWKLSMNGDNHNFFITFPPLQGVTLHYWKLIPSFSFCFIIQILGTPCWILWLRVEKIINSCLFFRCVFCLKNSHLGVISTQNQMFPRLWPKYVNYLNQFSSSFTILNVCLTLHRWCCPNSDAWSQNEFELAVNRYCPNGSISLIFHHCTLSSVV